MEENKISRETLVKQTVRQFIRANKLHREAFGRFANRYGLHRGQHRMLMFICKKGGGVSQKEIAEALDVSPAAITVMLNKLEESGYIRRVTSTLDSRVKQIHPTEKAVVLVTESRNYFDGLEITLLSGIEEEDLKKLCVAFEKMQENMQSMPKEV